MDQITTFFHMGGYALYVWPCFIISAVTLIALLIQSLRRQKSVERKLAAAESSRRDVRAGRAAPEAMRESL